MSWLDGLRARLIDRFGSGLRDRDLDEEIRFHLEMETSRQIERGRDPRTARAAALARFGDPAWVADATRNVRGPNHVEGAVQDIGWALRALRRHPGFAILALVTLALGIGATTVAFTVLDTVLIRPLPFRESERLVMIHELTDEHATLAPSFPNFIDWRARVTAFSGIASEMFPYNATITVGTEPASVSIMGVSHDFFRILGAPPVTGREFSAAESSVGGPFALMASYEFWRDALGGRLPLGEVRFNGRMTPIVGVAPPGFHLVGEADLFFPHEQWPGTIRSSHNYVVVGRLAPGATLQSARAAMTALSASLRSAFGDETQAVDASVQPLRDYMVRNVRLTVIIVFAAAALVLLIACTNLVSAQLAHGLAREREVAVRTALGASRARLVRQLFIESGVLAIGGAGLGVIVAAMLTRLVRALGAGLVPRLGELVVDARVLGFAAVLTVVTSLLIGLYPAFRLSSGEPGSALRGAARESNAQSGSRVWPLLIGFEIAVAVMLVIGSGLLIRTMRNILDSDVGFDPHGIITASLSPDTMPLAEAERIRQELASLPGVSGVAFVTRYPLLWGNEAGPVLRPGDSRSHWPAMAGFRVVSAGYFDVMRQPIMSGRAFGASDVAGSIPVAIITSGIANTLWPGQDPIGKLIRTNYLSEEWLTVVGVAAEATSWSQPRGTQNEIYVALPQHLRQAQSQIIAMVRTDRDTRTILPAVRTRLRAIAPTIPAKLGTIEERIAKTASDRRFATFALGAFGAIALILAGIGIYGVMSYSVVARAHEIGVRMALGATPLGIQALILSRAAGMALGGVVVGVAGGFLATRYISAILYGVTRADPIAYGAGVAFLLLTALVGAYVPARRSSRVDPLIAIRGD